MRCTCPHCHLPVAGTMEEITLHLKKCGVVEKPKRAPQRPERRLGCELPELPIIFRLSRPTPSQNSTTGWHWTKKAAEARAWVADLRLHVIAAKLENARLEWSCWRIERCYARPGRQFDFGNLVGGSKPIVDAFGPRGLNVIEDDSPDHVEVVYEQRLVDPAHTGTIITLVDARL